MTGSNCQLIFQHARHFWQDTDGARTILNQVKAGEFLEIKLRETRLDLATN